MKKHLACALVALYGLVACSSSQSQSQSASEEVTTAQAETPRERASAPFDADSAYHYIAEQLAFGARTPGSKAHREMGDWLEGKLRSWGYEVSEHRFMGRDYYGKPIEGRNIIARFGADEPRRILLMAHWDTRAVADHDPDRRQRETPIMGADDGGSGVGVLLELARQWRLSPAEGVGVELVFFDLEDGGRSGGADEDWCQGSQAWAKATKGSKPKPMYGILLDMVGAKGAKFYWEYHSMRYAKPLQRELWRVGRELGWGRYFISKEGGAAIDDHLPVIKERRIPSVDIINQSPEGGFGAHWHTQADDLDIIDKETLRAVGETVATTIASYHP